MSRATNKRNWSSSKTFRRTVPASRWSTRSGSESPFHFFILTAAITGGSGIVFFKTPGTLWAWNSIPDTSGRNDSSCLHTCSNSTPCLTGGTKRQRNTSHRAILLTAYVWGRESSGDMPGSPHDHSITEICPAIRNASGTQIALRSRRPEKGARAPENRRPRQPGRRPRGQGPCPGSWPRLPRR